MARLSQPRWFLGQLGQLVAYLAVGPSFVAAASWVAVASLVAACLAGPEGSPSAMAVAVAGGEAVRRYIVVRLVYRPS